jgi:catechol 2,3-dioxygenase-like lactoylglutathione lyase family enzyme
VDFGIIAADVARSVAFYQALGFQEVEGFDVPASMGRSAGLTDGKSDFHVRVMQLGDGDDATNVKIMSVPGTTPQRADGTYLHSRLGVTYLTLYVDDVDAAVARARRVGAAPLAEGPCKLPPNFPDGIWLACVRDPDGMIVELVGPKHA